VSKRDKLRRKLRNSPQGVKFQDLETLLLRFGFELMRISGSHHIFRITIDDESVNLIIPVHRQTGLCARYHRRVRSLVS
jgi:predicted RNA binding protein YcfA (HicA-like mRNA interferase family)